MALIERKLRVAIQLAPNTGTNQPNTFVESGTDTVTVENLRMIVRIQNSGSPADCRAQVQIFGMPPSLMNQLATLGMVFNIVPKNKMTIQAGNDTDGFATIFSGTILAAYGDYAAQPNVSFHFECNAGVGDAVAPVPVSSFTGSTSVKTIMEGFAQRMGRNLENNGISLQLSSPYFTGGVQEQARRCAADAGISWSPCSDGKTLAIWPKGGNRNTPSIPTISPATGMIGYPAFTQQGIIVKTLFNPLILFGSLVKVESSVLSGIASAQPTSNFPTQWAVNKLDLALDAMVPKGEWMSIVYCYNPNYSKAILPPVT